MSTCSKFTAFATSACLLGLAASGYATVFGDATGATSRRSLMQSGQVSIEVGPARTAMKAIPLNHVVLAPEVQGGTITLVPNLSLGGQLGPTQRPVTTEPIPTHWNPDPHTLIPVQWDARTILVRP